MSTGLCDYISWSNACVYNTILWLMVWADPMNDFILAEVQQNPYLWSDDVASFLTLFHGFCSILGLMVWADLINDFIFAYGQHYPYFMVRWYCLILTLFQGFSLYLVDGLG